MLGAIDPAAPQDAGQHRLAAKSIERQIAVGIVVPVKFRVLLIAMQGNVRGIDIQNQLVRRLRLPGDELLDQHPVQCDHIRAASAPFQTTQRRDADAGRI